MLSRLTAARQAAVLEGAPTGGIFRRSELWGDLTLHALAGGCAEQHPLPIREHASKKSKNTENAAFFICLVHG